jgi:hypothetical protein
MNIYIKYKLFIDKEAAKYFILFNSFTDFTCFFICDFIHAFIHVFPDKKYCFFRCANLNLDRMLFFNEGHGVD